MSGVLGGGANFNNSKNRCVPYYLWSMCGSTETLSRRLEQKRFCRLVRIQLRRGCLLTVLADFWHGSMMNIQRTGNVVIYKRLPVCPWLIWKQVCFRGGREQSTPFHKCTSKGAFTTQFILMSLKLACYCANTAILFKPFLFCTASTGCILLGML